ncbi:MAG: polysaccharide deacetylase family protein [Ornithinimicrobium sp.]|uniref:polysaccharide deacetylase family protein n=1 Tax=Ornithinimicrobium sp. TaxID=1977084 RepID=UPI0026DFB6D2|nr:polysaccharide deacetylase family protein [Ornithinimicrobium sp.]MDO5740826.1 polysaccharide deacetylase family protein [Ornithinimicrobium sp.]
MTPSAPALPTREDVVHTFGAQAPATFGLEVPGILLSHAGAGVALTFDLCGGPHGESFDHALWTLLQKHGIASTFFVNSRWLTANPSLARELAADPMIEIANHGHEHRPLTVDGSAAYGIRGTRDAGAAYDEVAAPVAALTKLSGTAPLWFRSGTAHCDDVGVRISEALGQRVVNFSINGDAGATFSAGQVATEVGRAGDGDIVIAHANQPGSGTAAGMALALPEMLARGVTFARLADVLPAASVLDVDH